MGQSSISREVSLEERICGFGIFDDGVHQMHNDTLAMHPIYSENVLDWEFLANHGLNTSFFKSIHSDPFSVLQSVNPSPNQRTYEPEHKGVKFRLGGEERKISLLELGWRLGLYSENQYKEDSTLSGQKDSTQRITEIDLFYLYCIYALGVGCNIPYWLTKYLKGVRDKNFIYGGMFVTRIARSFGLLTAEIVDVLSVEPPAYWGRLMRPGGAEECLRHNGRGLILYQAYGNLYVMTGRKAHLLEDKQIPSVRVFDEVSFYTLFRALGWLSEEIHVTWTQFGKKQDKIITLHIQNVETTSGFLVTPSEYANDGVRILLTASECNRLKEALEDSAEQRRRSYKETSS
ncbi:hypothetical protein Tco_0300387 [Tanacetum coccineum]